MGSHVVVVGAGIIGASIAWHLVKQGASVTVVAGKAGGEATPNSFAWINASWGNPEPYFRFRVQSMAEWKRLAGELPGLPLDWCGGLCWDLPPDRLEAYAAEHGRWGYGLGRIGREEIAAREPHLRNIPDFALVATEEGAVEPVAATQRMLADLTARGGRLLTAEVTGFVTAREQVRGVVSSAGTIEADHVVLAAGAGSVPLAAGLGIDLPVNAAPSVIVHSRPVEKRLNGLVIVPDLEMRQTADGRLVGCSGHDADRSEREQAEEIFSRLRNMLSDAGDVEMEQAATGYRPIPEDGFPIIGGVDAAPGLYVAVMHSGVTLAPLVGRLAAEEILGAEQPLLSPFRLSRFSQS